LLGAFALEAGPWFKRLDQIELRALRLPQFEPVVLDVRHGGRCIATSQASRELRQGRLLPPTFVA